jgi:UDP-glucuronate 4-epimerase
VRLPHFAIRSKVRAVAAILVTGAAGFIGSHVCERLLARGERVVGLDAFTDFYDPALKERNAAAVAAAPGARAGWRLERGDLRDRPAVAALLRAEGVDRVVHLGAWAGVRPSIARPALYMDVNVRGTVELVEACRDAGGVRGLLFASSSSVYGAASRLPFREDEPADRPVSPYGASKRAGELALHAAHHVHGLDVTCLRFFTVYGPRQRPEMAIHKFARLLERGEPVPVLGDGTSSRDYTYVDDIADGTLRALDALGRGAAAFRIYNLGREQPVTLAALVERLAAALRKPARLEHLPAEPGDVPHTFADVSLARAQLGFAPKVELDEGLARFVRWLRDA